MFDVSADLTNTERAAQLGHDAMVDVMLNFLLFFLLTSAFTYPTFGVDLPGAAHSHIDPEPKQPHHRPADAGQTALC